MLRVNDVPEFKDSRRVCRELNLENELNKPELLKRIYLDAYNLMGLSPQPLAPDLLAEKQGEVILRYASECSIDSNKVVTLLSRSQSKHEACRILGRTAVCLMEDWEILQGGIKIS